jgi:hypothetical protein
MNSSVSISHEDIAERAHKIWEREGRPLGQDLDHWLRAEQELQCEFPFPKDATLSHKTTLTKKK